MNFNPRAPCGARRCWRIASRSTERFQPTRPLRGATVFPDVVKETKNISTHAPLAGRDPRPQHSVRESLIFQPTRPLRGATFRGGEGDFFNGDFNPRAPCGARQMPGGMRSSPRSFQPTRPLRGATCLYRQAILIIQISTHAPLAGRDYRRVPRHLQRVGISTHAPLAGRDQRGENK